MSDLVSTHEASKIKAGAAGREASLIVDELGPAEILARAGRMRPLATAGALRASGEGRVAASLAASTEPLRDAAVLIGLVGRPDAPGLDLIMIRRTDGLRVHSGEVALPGGKIEPEDASPVEAALREAEEEVGLPMSAVEPVGLLAPYPTPSGFRIFPVIGLVDGRPALTANPSEVAEVFSVPLGFVLDPGNHREESIQHATGRRHFFSLQYGHHRIWGVTGNILRRFYEEVFR
jgi:8-oxo-dGTP pyrophosphatase MutT (NUDIX family)